MKDTCCNSIIHSTSYWIVNFIIILIYFVVKFCNRTRSYNSSSSYVFTLFFLNIHDTKIITIVEFFFSLEFPTKIWRRKDRETYIFSLNHTFLCVFCHLIVVQNCVECFVYCMLRCVWWNVQKFPTKNL
jgi:hypothetical protein